MSLVCSSIKFYLYSSNLNPLPIEDAVSKHSEQYPIIFQNKDLNHRTKNNKDKFVFRHSPSLK